MQCMTLQSKGVRYVYAVTRIRNQETGVSDILVRVHDAILGQMSALSSEEM
jgi:hypothetical protein